MDRTVVTILAAGYSGSHFLSLLIGSHSRGVHIGEAHHVLKRRQANERPLCFICKETDACRLFAGIGPANASQIYDLIFSRVDPAATLLVDASKSPSWAARFLSRPPYRMKYIHLIRDPRALVRRWLLTYTTPRQRFHIRWKTLRELPRHAPHLLFADMPVLLAYNWLRRNLEITEFIARHRLDTYLQTYRDLAKETPQALDPLMHWIGLDYEPSQLEYWNVEHHGSQKAGYEWVKEAKANYFDVRWKEFLSAEAQARITRDPVIAAYVRRLGLAFDTDGLTGSHPLGPAAPI
jgi:hypothetical protein